MNDTPPRPRSSDAQRYAVVVFGCAVVFGLGLRGLHFASEIGGPHTFRQSHVVSDVVSLALDAEQGPRLAPLERYDYAWAAGQRLFDVPLYQLLAAKLKDWSGLNALQAARTVSLLTFVISCAALRRLAAHLTSPLGAAVATVVYAISALSIQWHAAPMPDNLAVALSLTGLLLHFESRAAGTRRFALALLCVALATLIKPPTHLPVALALGLNGWWEGRTKALRDGKLLSHALIALAAATSFVLAAKQLNSGTEKEETLAWFFGTFEQRLELPRWAAFPRRLLSVFGHPLLAAPFAFGALALLQRALTRRASAFERLALCWLLGNAITAFVFFNVYSIHNYYQLPLLPLYAMLVAFGGEQALATWPRVAAWLKRHELVVLLASLCFVAHAVHFASWLPTLDYSTNRELVRLGERLKAATQRDDQLMLVMGTPVPGPEMMYYARRRGRVIDDDDDPASSLHAFTRRRARDYLLAFAPDVPETSRDAWLARTCGYDFAQVRIEPRLYRVRRATGATCEQSRPLQRHD